MAIEDISKYNTFKRAMLGPVDCSNWLIKGQLLIGAYPEGQANALTMIVTQRSSAVAQILMCGINTWVSLMTDDEVVDKTELYEVTEMPACGTPCVPTNPKRLVAVAAMSCTG